MRLLNAIYRDVLAGVWLWVFVVWSLLLLTSCDNKAPEDFVTLPKPPVVNSEVSLLGEWQIIKTTQGGACKDRVSPATALMQGDDTVKVIRLLRDSVFHRDVGGACVITTYFGGDYPTKALVASTQTKESFLFLLRQFIGNDGSVTDFTTFTDKKIILTYALPDRYTDTVILTRSP